MNHLEDFKLSATSTLLEAVEKIERNKARAVIIEKNDKVIGIVSEGDVMRALLNGSEIHAPVEDFVNHSFIYLNSVDRHKAFELARNVMASMIPVVDDDFHLTDIITLKQLLQDVTLPA